MIPGIYSRIAATFLVLATVAACGGSDATADTSREIELPPATSDAPLNDQPVTPPATPAPAPVTKAPAPRPTPPVRPPAARTASIAAGTALQLASGARICTNTHKVGDRFTATLTEAVTGTNDALLPAGTSVVLEMVESARGQNSTDAIKFAFKVVSVLINNADTPVVADVTQVAKIEAVRVQSNATQAGKVATGAAIGAVAGQLLGKNTKSTVAGAAVGAVAGGAVAAGTTDYEGCLPANGAITIALREPLAFGTAG